MTGALNFLAEWPHDSFPARHCVAQASPILSECSGGTRATPKDSQSGLLSASFRLPNALDF